MPREKNKAWVKGLDSLRFILAFIVLLSHFECPWVDYLKHFNDSYHRALGMLISNLFSGIGSVIAFFIISGFVIHYPNKNKIPATFNFLLSRWLRVGIPLLTVLAITDHNEAGAYIWSLYCELIYYTIYPLLIRIKLSWNLKFIVSFIISFVFVYFFCKNDIVSFTHQKNIHYIGAYWQLGTFFTWIIGLPCWILGVLLADKIDTSSIQVSAKKIFSLRILVFGLSVVLGILKFHYFVSFIFSMNIYALLLFVWLRAEIQYYKENPPLYILEKMGAFSYSLYLIHSLCLKVLRYYFPYTNLTYFIFIGLTIFMAYIYYLIIEKPSHLLAKKIASYVTV